MPHKDREARLAYLRAWKERRRTAPRPQPQADESLPFRGVIVVSEDGTKVQCHACGQWFGALNGHLRRHGLDAASYKALYELPRTASLLPPQTAEKQRQAALARDQGSIGRECLPPAQPRPKGLEQRLGVRIDASRSRKGIYTRGGNKTR